MTTPNSLDFKRTGSAITAISLELDNMPAGFPLMQWQEQASRYLDYWQWFDGTSIEERVDTTTGGQDILKFPLRINSVRNFSRKHATVLLGEEAFDSPEPMVKTIVSAKKYIDGDEIQPEEETEADFCESLVNDVWQQSNGRALQMENAILTQFLGGCIFGLRYDPRRDDLAIPIVVENVMPDFFLPVWSNNNYYNLLEAWIVYRIPGRVAALEWNLELTDASSYVTLVEHWTRYNYSIYVDGQPLKDQLGIVYDNLENPWGFVPFVYIPHLREGDFYGPSIIEDIVGLVKEYNARMADQGDAIRKTVHRIRYAYNLNRSPVPRMIGNGVWVIDLGQESPAHKNPPTVNVEDPPDLSTGLMSFSDDLWNQLLREASLGPIAFGEDEGSQRSALTLAFRMWPTTSHARQERTFWTDGLNRLAFMILKMIRWLQTNNGTRRNLGFLPLVVPDDFHQKFRLSQDWLPQIPRDREQMVNEIILRFQSGLLSIDKALQSFGDIRNIQDEKRLILEWKEAVAKVEAEYAQQPGASQDEGAETDLTTPVASSNAEDD